MQELELENCPHFFETACQHVELQRVWASEVEVGQEVLVKLSNCQADRKVVSTAIICKVHKFFIVSYCSLNLIESDPF
jgi:hypothetical protein